MFEWAIPKINDNKVCFKMKEFSGLKLSEKVWIQQKESSQNLGIPFVCGGVWVCVCKKSYFFEGTQSRQFMETVRNFLSVSGLV